MNKSFILLKISCTWQEQTMQGYQYVPYKSISSQFLFYFLLINYQTDFFNSFINVSNRSLQYGGVHWLLSCVKLKYWFGLIIFYCINSMGLGTSYKAYYSLSLSTGLLLEKMGLRQNLFSGVSFLVFVIIVSARYIFHNIRLTVNEFVTMQPKTVS